MKDFVGLPPGYVIFCDDIRDEVGGKQSYIGIYRGILLSSSDFPLVLPKLGLAITVRWPNDELVEDFELRIYLPGDVDERPTVRIPVNPQVPSGTAQENDEAQFVELYSSLTMSPVVLNTTGFIKVRAVTKDKTIKLGSLAVERSPLEQPQPT